MINSLVWLLNCEEKTLTFSFSSQDKQVSQDVLQYLSNRTYDLYMLLVPFQSGTETNGRPLRGKWHSFLFVNLV